MEEKVVYMCFYCKKLFKKRPKSCDKCNSDRFIPIRYSVIGKQPWWKFWKSEQEIEIIVENPRYRWLEPRIARL